MQQGSNLGWKTLVFSCVLGEYAWVVSMLKRRLSPHRSVDLPGVRPVGGSQPLSWASSWTSAPSKVTPKSKRNAATQGHESAQGMPID